MPTTSPVDFSATAHSPEESLDDFSDDSSLFDEILVTATPSTSMADSHQHLVPHNMPVKSMNAHEATAATLTTCPRPVYCAQDPQAREGNVEENAVPDEFSDESSLFEDMTGRGSSPSPPQSTPATMTCSIEKSEGSWEDQRTRPSQPQPPATETLKQTTTPFMSPHTPLNRPFRIPESKNIFRSPPEVQSVRSPASSPALRPTLRTIPATTKLAPSRFLPNLDSLSRLVTCFRVAELVRLRQQVRALPVPMDADRNIYIRALTVELYASIQSTSRSSLGQFVCFGDLFFPGKPPFVTAMHDSWRELQKGDGGRLLSTASVSLDVADPRRRCRAILRNRFDGGGKVIEELELLSLSEVDEEELTIVRGIIHPEFGG
jgi:hypothetical protein